MQKPTETPSVSFKFLKFELKEAGREGCIDIKVPDEKCQLEMVCNEDISHLRVGNCGLIVLVAARSVLRGNVVK